MTASKDHIVAEPSGGSSVSPERKTSSHAADSTLFDGATQTGSPHTHIKPQMRKTHDPDVTFEEYHYYAIRTREEERTLEAPRTQWKSLLAKKKHVSGQGEHGAAANMPTEKDLASRANRLEITDEEWTNASRAFRTASAGACE